MSAARAVAGYGRTIVGVAACPALAVGSPPEARTDEGAGPEERKAKTPEAEAEATSESRRRKPDGEPPDVSSNGEAIAVCMIRDSEKQKAESEEETPAARRRREDRKCQGTRCPDTARTRRPDTGL
ncbi:MAG: hypothetical protein M1824_003802 [Vezdaea acicularis]|nr:MAG: hypothetical protein M1824_003802 [Vezdaea acicularis]